MAWLKESSLRPPKLGSFFSRNDTANQDFGNYASINAAKKHSCFLVNSMPSLAKGRISLALTSCIRGFYPGPVRPAVLQEGGSICGW